MSQHSAKKGMANFFKNIHGNIIEHQQLDLPEGFVKKHGKELSDMVRVEVLFWVEAGAGGMTSFWNIEVRKADGVYFLCGSGWKAFVDHHSIDVGHVLYFTYYGTSRFSVIICGVNATEFSHTAEIGETSCVGGDEVTDGQVKKGLEAMVKRLKEKKDELENLEALKQTLIVKERNSNDKLKDVRKELINGLKDLSSLDLIGVKKLGELDPKPFRESCKRKFRSEEADVKCVELCSLWEDHLREPGWHPFKMIKGENGLKEIVDPEDGRLKGLKQEMGEEVVNAVSTALLERNEYNASGRYIIQEELWNYEENRKATLKEGVAFILSKWKAAKRTKK